MKKIKEVIVVEGRYDKNTLSQIVDATIVSIGGFSVFNDKEKLLFLRQLAEKQGLILLTDSDGAGFLIRNYLKGALPKELIKQAYIPDIYGKERRKRTPGKEGKLGVEGMRPEVILDALERAGATFLDHCDTVTTPKKKEITKGDFFTLGLSGSAGSAARRSALMKKLQLPEHLSSNALLEALNLLYDYDALESFIKEL